MTAADGAAEIVIIGAGPRGCSLLERLIANAELAGGRAVIIHLVDPAPVGGRVWRPDQPGHLLMNTLCADATHFTDDSVTCAGPIVPGPTLYDWCRWVTAGEVALDDAELIAMAEEMRPHSHPPRRLLGAYLDWCFRTDLGRLPPTMRVVEHRQTAVGCRPEADRLRVTLADGADLTADAVLIATGHADLAPGAAERSRIATARDHDRFYGRPANPIDQDLSAIAAGRPVIMRGLGMNFFDYVSLLTEGRGGRFEETDAGLVYRPSGAEPTMVVGSGRGTPYRAKAVFGTMTPRFPPSFLTAEVIERLHRRGMIDFTTELWPLIAKDTLAVYYETLARVRPEAFAADPELIMKALRECDWGGAELAAAIESVVPEPAQRADLAAWDRPLAGRRFDSPAALHAWWLADLRRDLAEAARGLDSPLKCASVMLGQGRTSLRTLVRYGGLLGHSYDAAVDRWYKGFAGSLASGPPARRIAELIALTEAGLVRPIGPELTVTESDRGFVAASGQVAGSEVIAAAFLECYLPAPDLRRTADPLLAGLRHAGLARPYRIPDHTGDPEPGAFESGAVEVGLEPYRLVGTDGSEHPRIFAVGVPLEGLHFGTQLGPLAGTNSRFLRETDAVARAALELLHL
ncbi:FAD/NAD(P)-binding protein [Microlunatus speluncae]|uniref:FAD/NAD(P)-binding protein n=1 Tax=Microlunatus speluncae TaxID=2594267 RepID=UPI0012665276|nr:FAD/NAD(P)-binding protein [Microlunatus speluncae]